MRRISSSTRSIISVSPNLNDEGNEKKNKVIKIWITLEFMIICLITFARCDREFAKIFQTYSRKKCDWMKLPFVLTDGHFSCIEIYCGLCGFCICCCRHRYHRHHFVFGLPSILVNSDFLSHSFCCVFLIKNYAQWRKVYLFLYVNFACPTPVCAPSNYMETLCTVLGSRTRIWYHFHFLSLARSHWPFTQVLVHVHTHCK